MKKVRLFGIMAGAALLTAIPVSLYGTQNHFVVSLDGSDARIGRPLTPMSVAGVHRRAYRQTRRVVCKCAVWPTGPSHINRS